MGDENLHAILEMLAAPIPSPAAASGAAVAASVGASLLIMAAATISHRLPEGAEKSVVEGLGDKAHRMRNMLEDVFDQDAKAYGRVVRLRAQQKGAERDEQLERAWKTATIIPGVLGRSAMICLKVAADLAPKAPLAARPDIVTAALLLHAAVQASLVIVQRNLTHVADQAFCQKIRRNQSFLDDRDALLVLVVQSAGSP